LRDRSGVKVHSSWPMPSSALHPRTPCPRRHPRVRRRPPFPPRQSTRRSAVSEVARLVTVVCGSATGRRAPGGRCADSARGDWGSESDDGSITRLRTSAGSVPRSCRECLLEASPNRWCCLGAWANEAPRPGLARLAAALAACRAVDRIATASTARVAAALLWRGTLEADQVLRSLAPRCRLAPQVVAVRRQIPKLRPDPAQSCQHSHLHPKFQHRPLAPMHCHQRSPRSRSHRSGCSVSDCTGGVAKTVAKF